MPLVAKRGKDTGPRPAPRSRSTRSPQGRLLTTWSASPLRSSSRFNSHALSSVLVSVHLGQLIDTDRNTSGMRVIAHCPSLSQQKSFSAACHSHVVVSLISVAGVCPQASSLRKTHPVEVGNQSKHKWQPVTVTDSVLYVSHKPKPFAD